MVLSNKMILSSEKGNEFTPIRSLIYQCFICSIALPVLKLFIKFNFCISMKNLFYFFIVNLSFIASMLANSYTLKYLSVHMVTLLKCLSVVFTAFGDFLFNKQKISLKIMISLLLVVIGSSFGLLTDIEFSVPGYLWMLVSICSSTAYVLLTKKLVSKTNIDFFTSVFMNNLMSTIVLLSYDYFMRREENILYPIYHVFQHKNKSFYGGPFFQTLTALMSLLLNIFTYSLLRYTSATSYVIVGAAKKVVQACVSFILFPKSITFANAMSVAIGLSGSILYADAKRKEKRDSNDNGSEDKYLPL